MSENNLIKFNCASCGIAFGIDKDVDAMWRGKQKQFWCPNGHSLVYTDTSKQDKELQSLKDSVKSLEEQLVTATANLAMQTKRADDLQAELDIWRPSSHEGK